MEAKRQRSPVGGPMLEGYPRPQAGWIRFQMRLGRRATRKSPALHILQVQAFKLSINVICATAILICLTRSRHRCQLAPDLRSGHTRSSTWPGQFGLDFTLSEISSASCSVGGESGGGGLGGWRGLGPKYGKHGSWPKKLISSLFFDCGQGSCLFLLASESKDSRAWKHNQPRSACLLFLSVGDTVMWASLSGLLSCGVCFILRSPMLILFHAYKCFACMCVPQAVKVRRERASDALELDYRFESPRTCWELNQVLWKSSEGS